MRQAFALLALLSLLPAVPAQVRFSREPYPFATVAPVLPVQPYRAAPAPAAPPAPTSEAIPTAATVATPAASAATAQLVIRQGHNVAEALRRYAQPAGWELVWEAAPYVAEREVVVSGSFELAMESFLEGANAAGAHIRAVFYRGNRTVRVWED